MNAPIHTLHVAAMPFPSPQGTQAAVRAMLEALVDAERPAALACYAHGADAAPPSFPIVRTPDFPRDRSLRSGPSWNKLALDVVLTNTIRAAQRSMAPRVVVAHHVEACGAAWLARAKPLLFVAHTDLGEELPSYSLPAGHLWARRAGASLDRWLASSATAVGAVSPLLVERLRASTGVDATYLPIPWRVAARTSPEERAQARAALGFDDGDDVLLYAGNLDAYQGWPLIVRALVQLSRRRPRLKLLVATASDSSPLREEALRAGIARRVVVTALEDEAARRRAHAAADVGVITRRSPGGIPIKLLDALARGLPVVAERRALAGLDVEDFVIASEDGDVDSFAAAVLLACDSATLRDAAREQGTRFLETEHAPRRFVEAFDTLLHRVEPLYTPPAPLPS